MIDKEKRVQGRTEDYLPQVSNAEAMICLKCTLPKCSASACKRYREEKAKLKRGKK